MATFMMKTCIGVSVCVIIFAPVYSLLSLQSHVEEGYIEVDLPEINENSTYILKYNIQGTRLQRIFEIGTESTKINITVEHPGSLVQIVLVKRQVRGSGEIIGTTYVRTWCQKEYILDIGDRVQIVSPGYPAVTIPYVVCKWRVRSANDTWLKISSHFQNLDVICPEYLKLNDDQECCRSTMLYKSSSGEITHQNKERETNPYNITIEAVSALYPPYNVTCTTQSDSIVVNWKLSQHHAENMSIVLTYYIFPENETTSSVLLDSNATQYVIDASDYKGRLFGLYLKVMAVYGESALTELIEIRSECMKNITVNSDSILLISDANFTIASLCVFNIQTHDNMKWIKIEAVRKSPCSDSYVVANDRRVVCGSHGNVSWTVPANNDTIEYMTDSNTNNSGITLLISSVDKPTDPPTVVKTQKSDNSILVTWQHPESTFFCRSNVIRNYIIKYKISPYMTDNILKTSGLNKTIVVETSAHSGQLYEIQVASETNGGRSSFTKPVYIRAACGQTAYLVPLQTKVIIFPGLSRPQYLPNTLCSWTFRTDVSLWFEVMIESLNIEQSPGCRKDGLQIGNSTKLCGNMFHRRFVHQTNNIQIVFTSDAVFEDTGFIISVTAVGSPPNRPRDLKVSTSTYSLVIKWKPPLYRFIFITSYSLYYTLTSTKTPEEIRISRDQSVYVLDTNSNPGSRYEIWMVTNGAVGTSLETEHIYMYAECGASVYLGNASHFISTPFYGEWRPRDARCIWKITSDTANVLLRVIHMQMPQFADASCGNVVFQVTPYKDVCNFQEKKEIRLSTSTAELSLMVRNNTEIVSFFITLESIIKDSSISNYNFNQINNISGARPNNSYQEKSLTVWYMFLILSTTSMTLH